MPKLAPLSPRTRAAHELPPIKCTSSAQVNTRRQGVESSGSLKKLLAADLYETVHPSFSRPNGGAGEKIPSLNSVVRSRPGPRNSPEEVSPGVQVMTRERKA